MEADLAYMQRVLYIAFNSPPGGDAIALVAAVRAGTRLERGHSMQHGPRGESRTKERGVNKPWTAQPEALSVSRSRGAFLKEGSNSRCGTGKLDMPSGVAAGKRTKSLQNEMKPSDSLVVAHRKPDCLPAWSHHPLAQQPIPDSASVPSQRSRMKMHETIQAKNTTSTEKKIDPKT